MPLRLTKTNWLRHPVAFVCFALVMFVPNVEAAPADEIKALLDQGKVAEAYQRGRQSPDQFGQPEFDFYFGIAAINAQRAAEGVLALERFLLQFPDNASARLELARGYYLISEMNRAKEEFQAVLRANPGAAVLAVVNEYLAAISDAESKYQAKVAWYAEVGGGHDSNVPSGVEDPTITLPIFGLITLADSAVKSADRFAIAGAGVRFTMPVRRNLQLSFSASAEQRTHRDIDVFDQESLAYGAGLNWLLGEKTVARFSATQSTQTIDHEKYRDAPTLGLEFGHQFSPATSILVGAQTARFRYASFNSIRNADYETGTLGLKQRFAFAWRPELEVSLSLGREKLDAADRQELSRDLVGGRLGATISPASAWLVSVSASYLKSEYQAQDPLLLVVRDDRYTSYDIGLAYTLPRGWSVRGEYGHSRNKSNLALYEYKRRQGSLKLRYDFK